jgi:hypothetical protein
VAELTAQCFCYLRLVGFIVRVLVVAAGEIVFLIILVVPVLGINVIMVKTRVLSRGEQQSSVESRRSLARRTRFIASGSL